MFNPVASYGYLLHTVFLWQILQIQTCLCVVVGPEFVSTSHTFMRSSASQPVGPHDRLAQKTVNCWKREVLTKFPQQFVTTVTAPSLVGCVGRSMLVSYSARSCRHHFSDALKFFKSVK